MTHSWESEFRREVASWFIDRDFRVRSNVYLRPSGRYADLIVEGPFAVWAVETESRFESALSGVSQASIYAEGIAPEYPQKPIVPVVAVPADHVDEPERSYIEDRTGVNIFEWRF